MRQREELDVVSWGPTEQRQVVREPLGEEPGLLVVREACFRVTLGQLLVALPHDVRKVAELGDLARADSKPSERTVQRKLARCARQQIFAAQHVGDSHQCVVRRVHEGVERVAVGANEDEVRHVLGTESHLATHEVIPGPVLIGHPEPRDTGSPRCAIFSCLFFGQVAAVSVVPGVPAFLARNLATFGQFLRRAEARVGVTGFGKLGDHIAVDMATFRLPVRTVVPADLGAFVPVETEPTQRVQQRGVGLLRVTGGVGVFNAEHEGPARVPGVCPVEQRRTKHSDVRITGW